MSSAPTTVRDAVSFVKTSRNSDGHELMSPSLFARMIARERKRSDRCRNGFILMLLEGRSLFAQHKVLDKVVAALPACMRDTDLSGWYRDAETVGVIFTEVTTETNDDAVEILQQR